MFCPVESFLEESDWKYKLHVVDQAGVIKSFTYLMWLDKNEKIHTSLFSDVLHLSWYW